MTNRSRVIELGGNPEPVVPVLPGELLVTIYRDPLTAVLDMELRASYVILKPTRMRSPGTRGQAVEIAREIIDAIGFHGTIRWQFGKKGVIRDAPT